MVSGGTTVKIANTPFVDQHYFPVQLRRCFPLPSCSADSVHSCSQVSSSAHLGGRPDYVRQYFDERAIGPHWYSCSLIHAAKVMAGPSRYEMKMPPCMDWISTKVTAYSTHLFLFFDTTRFQRSTTQSPPELPDWLQYSGSCSNVPWVGMEARSGTRNLPTACCSMCYVKNYYYVRTNIASHDAFAHPRSYLL